MEALGPPITLPIPKRESASPESHAVESRSLVYKRAQGRKISGA